MPSQKLQLRCRVVVVVVVRRLAPVACGRDCGALWRPLGLTSCGFIQGFAFGRGAPNLDWGPGRMVINPNGAPGTPTGPPWAPPRGFVRPPPHGGEAGGGGGGAHSLTPSSAQSRLADMRQTPKLHFPWLHVHWLFRCEHRHLPPPGPWY
jgi:hypothetical protein